MAGTMGVPRGSGAFHARRCIVTTGLEARAFAVIVTMITSHLVAPAPQALAGARMARPGEIALEVTFVGCDGTVSAYEPLLARLDWHSRTAETISVRLGNGVEPNTYVEVHDADGTVLASTPRPHPEFGGMQGGFHVAGGETYSEIWILTGLYQFREPGVYTIHFRLLDWVEGLPVIAEETVSVQVLPFDAARLEARCQDLFAAIYRRTRSEPQVSLVVAAKALRSVLHDIALPYLDWMAREWDDRYACRAIRRIGSERSEKLMAALAARADGVGTAMEQAMRLRLETGYADYGP